MITVANLPAALAVGDHAGDTAWMLTSAALVLLMVPGLALFYGGMVRRKNVLTTMMHSFVAMAVIGVQWIVIGYALAFGADWHGLVGWCHRCVGLIGVSRLSQYHEGIPELVFVMFQGKFAIITPALISGAVAERIKFSAYVLFILLWSTLIYDPLAHWVWADGGWLLKLGVLDFAGGTVVHVSAGVSAMALILLLGKRRDYPHGAIQPNNLVLTLTGAGLLWFGWFGFNAGSAVAVTGEPIAGPTAGLAFATTQTAAAAAALVWILMEWLHRGKPTSLGIASGIVAGLVAVTPAAGYIIPLWALVIGGAASALCYTAVQIKARLSYDDSLDAFGVHGVGGAWGALATGLFCSVGATGLVYGDGGVQFLKQLVGVGAAAGFAFFGTLAIGLAIKHTIGLRVSEQQERDGLDLSMHGEQGYHLELT